MAGQVASALVGYLSVSLPTSWTKILYMWKLFEEGFHFVSLLVSIYLYFNFYYFVATSAKVSYFITVHFSVSSH